MPDQLLCLGFEALGQATLSNLPPMSSEGLKEDLRHFDLGAASCQHCMVTSFWKSSNTSSKFPLPFWNGESPVVCHPNFQVTHEETETRSGLLMHPEPSSFLLVVELPLQPFLPTPGLFESQETTSVGVRLALCL